MNGMSAWLRNDSLGVLRCAKREYNPVALPSSNKRLAKHVLLFNPTRFMCKHSSWIVSLDTLSPRKWWWQMAEELVISVERCMFTSQNN